MSVAEQVAFGPLTIRFDDTVLRPRPWTERQSQWAAELIDRAPPGPVLDLCTGAGHLGLAAVADSDRRVVLVDVSPTACAFARRNADASGFGDRVGVRLGSIDEVLWDDEQFAVIVADPPWVPAEEVERYPEDPVSAIDGGPDGLDVLRLCLGVIDRHLADGGFAVLQAGPGQAASLTAELEAGSGGLRVSEVETHERGDLLLLDRFTDSPTSTGYAEEHEGSHLAGKPKRQRRNGRRPRP